MAVPMGTVAAELKSARARAIIKPIMEESPILQQIKVVNTGGDLQYMYNQDLTLPTASYIGINQASPTATNGTQRRVSQTVARMVIPMRIDNVFTQTPAIWEREEVKQMRMAGMAAGFQFSADFFDGDPSSNPLKPTGLYKYLNDGVASGFIPSNQKIDAGDGGAQMTLTMLDELVDAVKGDNRVIFCNARMKRKVLSLVRDSASNGMLRIQQKENEFGKKFEEYDGIPIRVIERSDDYSTVLDFDEDEGTGGTDNTCSVWCVSFGDEMGVYAFAPQGLGFSVEPFVKVPGQTYHDSLSEWLFNYVVAGPRACARLYHVDQPTF